MRIYLNFDLIIKNYISNIYNEFLEISSKLRENIWINIIQMI